jgi:hypothetical protein
MTAGQFWGSDIIDMLVAPLALSGVQPYAAWKQLPGDAVIAPYHRPEKINIIVLGGETSPLWKAADFDFMASASIDKWRARAPTGPKDQSGREVEEACGAYEAAED